MIEYIRIKLGVFSKTKIQYFIKTEVKMDFYQLSIANFKIDMLESEIK